MEITFSKVDKKILNNIVEFCKINNLDCESYVNDILKRGFAIDKYGEKPPFIPNKKEEKKVVKKVTTRRKKEDEKPTETISEVSMDENIKLKVKKTNKRTLNE